MGNKQARSPDAPVVLYVLWDCDSAKPPPSVPINRVVDAIIDTNRMYGTVGTFLAFGSADVGLPREKVDELASLGVTYFVQEGAQRFKAQTALIEAFSKLSKELVADASRVVNLVVITSATNDCLRKQEAALKALSDSLACFNEVILVGDVMEGSRLADLPCTKLSWTALLETLPPGSVAASSVSATSHFTTGTTSGGGRGAGSIAGGGWARGRGGGGGGGWGSDRSARRSRSPAGAGLRDRILVLLEERKWGATAGELRDLYIEQYGEAIPSTDLDTIRPPGCIDWPAHDGTYRLFHTFLMLQSHKDAALAAIEAIRAKHPEGVSASYVPGAVYQLLGKTIPWSGHAEKFGTILLKLHPNILWVEETRLFQWVPEGLPSPPPPSPPADDTNVEWTFDVAATDSSPAVRGTVSVNRKAMLTDVMKLVGLPRGTHLAMKNDATGEYEILSYGDDHPALLRHGLSGPIILASEVFPSLDTSITVHADLGEGGFRTAKCHLYDPFVEVGRKLRVPETTALFFGSKRLHLVPTLHHYGVWDGAVFRLAPSAGEVKKP